MQQFRAINSLNNGHDTASHSWRRDADGPREEPSLKQILRILRRSSRAIAMIVAAGAVPLGLMAALLPQRHSATALMKVSLPIAVPADFRASQRIVDTHLVSLRSRDFLRTVLKSIEAEAGSTEEGGEVRKYSGFVVDTLGLKTPSFEQRLDAFQKRLEVSQALSSDVISIRFSSTNPQLAADAANRIAFDYARLRLSAEEETLRQGADRLEDHIAELRLSLESNLDQIQEKLEAAAKPETKKSIAKLEASARSDVQLLDSLIRKHVETKRQLAVVDPGIEMVSRASPPASGSTLHPLLIFLPGLALLMLGASYWAFAREQSEKPLRSSADVVSALNIGCIGFFPKTHSWRSGWQPGRLARNPHSPEAEALRSVVVALEADGHGTGRHVVLLGGTDQRTDSMSLGLGIGQYARSTGHRVLLMDLDLRKPRLAKQLGIVLERDLSDVALAGAAIAEAIRRERQTGCDVLALRDPVTDPLHFASTDAMHAAVQHGRKGYDLVLMIGPTDIRRKADVAKLAALADLAILVLPWGIPSDAAKAAVRELRGNKTRTSSSSINAVLTGVPSHEIDLAMSPEGPNGTP
jgi:uncharacterized protein involved in exopolysaccharide biosynthesis/Mrp family chromosome partitioning ATPase